MKNHPQQTTHKTVLNNQQIDNLVQALEIAIASGKIDNSKFDQNNICFVDPSSTLKMLREVAECTNAELTHGLCI
ncbi:MAG: hypothetical protein Unbinned4162contig1001_34 [Prokaryotic dsDNA virus sp.]|nr:MAG: hypothetical protein Unbinned4162contig1001_34 [Prokaryotic dsDNA virus sp.]|tara:strand:- start:6974 stop:7198 length:225 start_codon:yes stop_codon:yes gene_type:complete